VTAFRDQLAVDVSATFLNSEEFGEAVVVDGVTVTGILEADTTQGDGAVGGRAGGDSYEASFVRQQTLHVASTDLARPEDGQSLTLGSGLTAVAWYVRQVDEAEGMLSIRLERQEPT
jgi:hypothetical protein